MKIGITDYMDAGLDQSWRQHMDKVTEGGSETVGGTDDPQAPQPGPEEESPE